MIRRPPSSTLFPYPPLFRSVLVALAPRAWRPAIAAQVAWSAALFLAVTATSPHGLHRVDDPFANLWLPRLLAGELAPTTAADRKSTRLNSSHANISYAVFCL